ncbi:MULTISPECIES: hypothetical protein [unclassified Bradyrhizobium]|nr:MULTISPECIES: hypothetical protein [unclassified Bradyrhizobium]
MLKATRCDHCKDEFALEELTVLAPPAGDGMRRRIMIQTISRGCAITIVGLFSLAALKAQPAHGQEVKGKRTNAYMKDAGKKAAVTRAANAAAKLRSEAARKAVATLRANALRAGNGQAAKT